MKPSVILSAGDANPLDYGGFWILDIGGDLSCEVLIPPEDEEGIHELFRFPLPSFTFRNGILSDNPFHPSCEVWFAGDLFLVSSAVGMTSEEVRDLLLSSDPAERGQGMHILVSYFGAHEFDSYPLQLTRKEAEGKVQDL